LTFKYKFIEFAGVKSFCLTMTNNFSVIVHPIVTEKTVATDGKVTFKVDSNASKDDVKKAVKEFYGVEVAGVNAMNMPEKKRMVARGRLVRKRAPFKKVVVTLKEGEKIDFNAFK